MSTSASQNSQSHRPAFLHPALIFCGVWILILVLYAAHMSELLLYPTSAVIAFELPVFCTFLFVLILTPFLPIRLTGPGTWQMSTDQATVDLLDRRLGFWFKIWMISSIAEIIASGGIPLIWLFTGSSKTYFDFGIPSIHGLLNSMLLAIAITRLAIALKFGRKKDFLVPAWTLLWATCLVTRQMIIVLLIEAGMVYCYQRPLKVKRVLGGIVSVSFFVYVFGLLGDLRSGARNFIQLAQPTANFPEWLPSGFLWVYIYLTTPINNLLYTIHGSTPAYDPRFPSTLSLLLPSVIRKIIFSEDASLRAGSGDLVSEAFNVSTAYAGPFEDFGWLGMVLFTVLIACLAGLYWRKRTLRDLLCYAVVCQCLVLSIFYNHFVYLPIISQILWLYLFFRRTGGNVNLSHVVIPS